MSKQDWQQFHFTDKNLQIACFQKKINPGLQFLFAEVMF